MYASGWLSVAIGLATLALLLQRCLRIPEPTIVVVAHVARILLRNGKDDSMKWVTRERPKTDRIACPWLIQKFIDPDAEFLYVPAEQVLEAAERESAHSYDAPYAEFTHHDGLCSFEVLVDEYEIDDPAVQLLARIVHGADIADDRDATPQSRGLLAIAEGFHLLELGDHRQLELSLPVYDALYAWCKAEVEAGSVAA